MRRVLVAAVLLGLAGCDIITPDPKPTPTPTPTVAPSPSASASPSPSASPSTSPSSTPTASPSPSGSPPAAAWPNPTNTGVRVTTLVDRSSSLTVTQAGTVVQGLRFTGGADLVVSATGVIVRDVEFVGGGIDNNVAGLLVEHVTFTGSNAGQSNGVLGPCGYTARRVEINGPSEGFRVGANCGPVVIEDSYARVTRPTSVSCSDYHGDAVQAYGAGAVTKLTVRRSTLHLDDSCGTAPYFVPRGSNQGNSNTVDVDQLLVVGGGYSFRLGMPGTVKGLRIAAGRYGYGPVDVHCDAITWSDWRAVPLDSVGVAGNYQPTGAGTPVTCTGDGT